jgi:hypothetical protein
MHPWEWPEKPWARLYIDHAGPVLGKTLLITVDAHSKWIDAHIVSSTSSAATIEKLRATFATHSLPQTVVSDNDPAFTSSELLEFMQCNGIEHLRSTPYHPSSNGLAERAVQTVKTGVQKLTGTLEVRLSRFLFKYWVTPQATTGIAPAELLMGCRLRTHLDLLYPTVKERVQRRQRDRKENHEGQPRTVSFHPGDRVMGQNFATGPRWLPGTVLECEGDTAVQIKMDDGRIWRRHLDHVIHSQVPEETGEQKQSDPFVLPPESDLLTAPAEHAPTTDHDSARPEQESQREPKQVEPQTRTLSPRDSDDQLKTDILPTAINDLFSLRGEELRGI